MTENHHLRELIIYVNYMVKDMICCYIPRYTSGGEWFKLNEESARTIDDNNWLDGDIIDFILR